MSSKETSIPYEQLWAYAHGRLSREDTRRVEGLLLDDPLSAAALEGILLAKDHSKTLQTPVLNFNRLESSDATSTGPKKSWLQWAAILALLVLAAIATTNYFQQQGPDRLVERYLPEIDPISTMRSTGNIALHPELKAAHEHVYRHAYAEALPYFINYLEVAPEDFTTTVEAATVALRAEQSKQAAEWFRRVRFNDNNAYGVGTLGLALAHVQARERDEAIILLKELSQSNSPQQPLADEILSELQAE